MSTLTITDFDAAMKALRHRDLRQGLYDEGAVLMDRVLVNLHGDEHRDRRNVEAKVFRKDFFNYYEHEVFPKTLELTIRPYLEKGRADVVEFGFRSMMSLTADFAGIDRQDYSAEETETLLSMLRAFGQGATLSHSKRNRDEVRAEVRAAMAEYDRRFLQPSIKVRQAAIARFRAGEISEDDLPRDILTVLLFNRDKLDLPDDVLLREMAFFFVAGAQTSIHSLTHAVHEIMNWCVKNPKDWQRIVDEPLFLQRCVHESTRLHPSSPVATRRPTCPIHLDPGHDVTPDDIVVANLYEANRDSKIFGPDAAEFNPHRETPSGVYPYGLSFGYGMHACLGRNLAAGVEPRPTTDPVTHQYGTVTLICQALFRNGARPDPENPPRMDETTARPNWGIYPIVFSGNAKA
jgi:cytochrome P450